jgi:hypothetical protein
MAFKKKIIFLILGLGVQLFGFPSASAQPFEASDDATGQEISLPASERGRDRTFVSFSPVVVRGEVVGALAIYDNPNTERPADYWELYDNTGDLIAIDWFDEFGIERLAIDRGLVEETNQLEGVFVVLLDGDSV